MRRLFMQLAVAGTSKALGSIISVAFSIYVARVLGASEAGYFFLGMTLLNVGSAMFSLGFDARLTRSFGSHGIEEASNRIFGFAFFTSSVTSVVFCSILYAFSDPIAEHIFIKAEISPILRSVSIGIPLLTLLNLLGFSFQGIRMSFMSVFSQNLGYLSFGFAAFYIVDNWQDLAISANQGTQIISIAIFVSLIISVIYWRIMPNTSLKFRVATSRSELNTNFDLWVSTMMSMVTTWSGILIGGIFITSTELAFIAAAQRTAVLIVFVLLVCDLFVAPRYAKMYASGRLNDMRYLAKLSTWSMLLVTVPLTIGVLFFSEQIMSIFGDGFEGASSLLIILVISQTINVATGSVGLLLTMCGQEREYRRATIIAGTTAICLTILLAPGFGAMGIAISSATGIIVQNIIGFFAVHRKLGFYPGF